MNFLFKMADLHIPGFIRRRELERLFSLTASGFGVPLPPVKGLSYDKLLDKYAGFTRTAVDQAILRGENLMDIEKRLFQNALSYGKRWRKRLAVSGMDEIMKAGKILYRAIGIEFSGTDSGEVKISRCFFSSTYSSVTCRVISAVDAGIMSGLSDGRSFSFSRRMTEGFPDCTASLTQQKVNS